MKKSFIVAGIIVYVLTASVIVSGVAEARTNFLRVLGLRVDGEIWRGPKAGTRDKTPVVVNDNLKVTGDIVMSGVSLKTKIAELAAQSCNQTCPSIPPVAPSADTQLRMAVAAYVMCINNAQNSHDQEKVKHDIQGCTGVFMSASGM